MTKKMEIDHTRYELVGRGKQRHRATGDAVSELTHGMTPEQIECLTALTGRVRSWPLLNPGQRVMNARNVLRYWVAKEPARLEMIKGAIRANTAKNDS